MFRDSIDQKTLAQKMGNTPAAVSRILSVANPTYETLERLADVFSVKPFTLVMSPEDYAKWDSLINPEAATSPQGSVREKLIAATFGLEEPYLKFLLEMVENHMAVTTGQEKQKARK